MKKPKFLDVTQSDAPYYIAAAVIGGTAAAAVYLTVEPLIKNLIKK